MDAPLIWKPTSSTIERANITQVMTALKFSDVASFHQWSVSEYSQFWEYTIKKLNIRFAQLPQTICDTSSGAETPNWLVGTTLNIVDSCFQADADAPAIYYQDTNRISVISFYQLQQLVNRIANSLVHAGYSAGDAIAIIMPMNHIAIASYLAIIKIGAVVVSIADSFSSEEIATRLRIANAKAVITQASITWDNKTLPLYEKIINANAPICIVASCMQQLLREGDLLWETFLSDNTDFESINCAPMSPCNILFSSGTTGEPKAIAWNQTTPIKTASDAFYHHNIQERDILAWPTNLGWMMGPWLIFAAFINRAAIALYTDSPKERAFGQFVQNAKVTMLGVVPTLVAHWRQTKCMEGLDWQQIKVFSSTGECSNPTDMAYLMSLAGNKPVIEYCGGTEIGGAYVSSTVVQDNYPSLFSTPTMGTNFVILNEQGQLANEGEVAIIPPVMGLSTSLLNADHHQIYYANMPTTSDGKLLRRHGDQIEKLDNGYYRLLGRIDDTMNLGGIKISAVEIERAIAYSVPEIKETAAIAVSPPDNGPCLLVIYAATDILSLDKTDVRNCFQQHISRHLNPLFKVHDIVLVHDLPKTASNKIMRRMLRSQYNNDFH